MADGRTVLVRPIRPEDEPGFQKIFESLTPDEIRMRFLHPMNMLPHDQAASLTQIDYDREMALVLEGQDSGGKAILLGAVRICLDPDNESAEFAILLRREVTGSGFGPMMLRRIIDYGRQRGLKRIFGDVLIDNSPMLKLARAFGFTVKPVHDDQSIRLVELLL